MVKPAALLVLLSSVFFTIAAHAQSFEKGATLVLLSNMHYEPGRAELFTLNYQLPALMPMCDQITVVKKSKKKMVFTWKSVEHVIAYDKHTKKAGQSFEAALSTYFGTECDSDKVSTMSELDRQGIRKGLPLAGMTRQGILYAMGRPPVHANPDLESSTWMYWLNRFKRQAIDFDDNGRVEDIRL